MEQAILNTVFEAEREVREMAAAEQQRAVGNLAQFQERYHPNLYVNQRKGEL
jgi:hypothetical protein